MAINWKQYPVSKTLSASDTVIASRPDGSTFNIDSPISCNRSGVTITGTLTVTGTLTGTSQIATTVTVVDESSDTTCFPLFATAATGNLAPKSGSNLTFNSSSGRLAATTFAGDVSGGTITTDQVVATPTLADEDEEACVTLEGGKTKIAKRRFDITSSSVPASEGDIVYFGSTTSMTGGKIYHYKNNGTWEKANADDASTSDGLLAVALGASSNNNGMLIRGMVTLDHDPGAIGDVLYLQSDNAGTVGEATSTAPSATGDCVRIIGYCLTASNGQIWFNPNSSFTIV